MSDDPSGPTARRRPLLKGLGLAAFSLPTTAGGAVGQQASDTVVLGDFESGLDGWRTNGRNRLSRVSAEDRPAAVTSGERALDVEVNGDAFPMIVNWQKVRRADFVDHPYLIADVAPSQVSDTASEVTFQFRYFYGAASDGGRWNDREDHRGDREKRWGKRNEDRDEGRRNGSDDREDGWGKRDWDRDGRRRKGSHGRGRSDHEDGRARGWWGDGHDRIQMAESEEITVRPLLPSRIYWDMSELPEEARSSPKWLEIVWYATDHPPKGGPFGYQWWTEGDRRENPGEGKRRWGEHEGEDERRWGKRRRGDRFRYEGTVVFDSIRLSDTIDDISNRAASQAFLDLEFEHGIYLETEVTDRTETTETGEFVFDDGTAIPYSFEVLSEDRAIYTLDGEEYRLGGGW